MKAICVMSAILALGCSLGRADESSLRVDSELRFACHERTPAGSPLALDEFPAEYLVAKKSGSRARCELTTVVHGPRKVQMYHELVPCGVDPADRALYRVRLYDFKLGRTPDGKISRRASYLVIDTRSPENSGVWFQMDDQAPRRVTEERCADVNRSPGWLFSEDSFARLAQGMPKAAPGAVIERESRAEIGVTISHSPAPKRDMSPKFVAF